MAILSKGQTFADAGAVTSTKLNNLVDNAAFVTGSSGSTDDSSLEVNGSGRLQVKDGGISAAKLGSGVITAAKLETSTSAITGVTYNKIQYVANMKALGNTTGALAAPSEISILDEDDMASDSATALATQQSIKAYYVDRTTSIYHVREEQASGTNAGTSATGVNTRVLNTEVYANITGASLSANRVTLPAGTYKVNARAAALRSDGTRLYLYNVSDAATELLGGNIKGSSGVAVDNQALLYGVMTIASTKVFELRQYIQTGRSTDGLGGDVPDGQSEVYAEIIFTKLN